MKYIFGLTGKEKTIEELFLAHHKCCPGCRGTVTWPINDLGERCYQCTCGFKWQIPSITKENLEKFRLFL